jgi:hypothetical protein
MNPKTKEIREKNSKSHIVQKFNWLLVCKQCGSVFSLNLSNKVFLSKKHTKYCNKCKVKRNKIPYEKYGIKNIDTSKKYNVTLQCSKCNHTFTAYLSGYTITRPNYKPICKKCLYKKKIKNIIKNKPYEQLSNTIRKNIIWNEQDQKCNHCGFNKYDIESGPYNLHHKDGNNKNHNRSNEEILCCNCHYMTDTYGFRGRKHTTETIKNLRNINKARE